MVRVLIPVVSDASIAFMSVKRCQGFIALGLPLIDSGCSIYRVQCPVASKTSISIQVSKTSSKYNAAQ